MYTEILPINVRTDGASGYSPTLSCYIPNRSHEIDPNRRRRAVIVCPGGAYAYRSDREGEPIALAFASRDIAAFVLNYSTSPAVYPQALCEAAEAIETVRSRADEWGIDPHGIAIAGFSAGGHLAASAGVLFDDPILSDALGTDPLSHRPDGMILGYPVITFGEFGHRDSFKFLLGDNFSDEAACILSLERRITDRTPPAFLWHTFTDECVPVQNTIMFTSELARHKIPFESHIFPSGPHGLARCDATTAGPESQHFMHPEYSGWINDAVRWLMQLHG